MIKLIILRNRGKTIMCMEKPFAIAMANIYMRKGRTVIFKEMDE